VHARLEPLLGEPLEVGDVDRLSGSLVHGGDYKSGGNAAVESASHWVWVRNMTPPQDPRPQDPAPASDPEAQEGSPADEGPGTGAQLAEEARAQARALDSGPTVSILGGEVARRTLLALGAFVLVFLLVWIALWGVFGSVGLALGWIVATAAGGGAVWLLAQRSTAR